MKVEHFSREDLCLKLLANIHISEETEYNKTNIINGLTNIILEYDGNFNEATKKHNFDKICADNYIDQKMFASLIIKSILECKENA